MDVAFDLHGVRFGLGVDDRNNRAFLNSRIEQGISLRIRVSVMQDGIIAGDVDRLPGSYQERVRNERAIPLVEHNRLLRGRFRSAAAGSTLQKDIYVGDAALSNDKLLIGNRLGRAD